VRQTATACCTAGSKAKLKSDRSAVISACLSFAASQACRCAPALSRHLPRQACSTYRRPLRTWLRRMPWLRCRTRQSCAVATCEGTSRSGISSSRAARVLMLSTMTRTSIPMPTTTRLLSLQRLLFPALTVLPRLLVPVVLWSRQHHRDRRVALKERTHHVPEQSTPLRVLCRQASLRLEATRG